MLNHGSNSTIPLPGVVIKASMKNLDRVAIVVPLYKRQLSCYEKISLKVLDRVLSQYPKIIVKPASLDIQFSDWEVVDFGDYFFKSRTHYSQLLLDVSFYKTFSNVEYILIYQTDCLVFSDHLNYWCDRGYDYIGPLWDRVEIERWEKVVWSYLDYGCGNGGFSLRNVNSCIRTLELTAEVAIPLVGGDRTYHCLGDLLQAYTHYLHEGKVFSRNEDMFWGFWARKNNLDFCLGTVEDALAFGFEYNPQKCIRMNKGKLPFGAHAWFKFDESKNFWLNVLRQKYPLDETLLEIC